MPTQEQMWDSVRETLDVFSARLMEADERVKEQNKKIATMTGKADGLEAQLGGMHTRIADLERQMNAIAYQQAEE